MIPCWVQVLLCLITTVLGVGLVASYFNRRARQERRGKCDEQRVHEATIDAISRESVRQANEYDRRIDEIARTWRDSPVRVQESDLVDPGPSFHQVVNEERLSNYDGRLG